MANKYWILRGCVTLGKFNSGGQKIGGIELHNTELELTVEHTIIEHENTCEEVSVIDARDVVKTMVKAKVTFDQVKTDVLALAMGGVVTAKATGDTFSAQSFQSGLIVGDVVPVPGGFMNLESLVLTDSTGSPVTLTAGTHYSVDLRAGLVTILSLSGLTQPLKAAGEEVDNYDVISVNTATKQERWLRFDGVNVNDSKRIMVDLHKLSFDPVNIALKNSGNDYTTFAFEPTLIVDDLAPMNSTFGKYGRLISANA